MPEINLTVKIIGGKRTDTEVYVESRSITNKKTITFKNGARLSEDDFIDAIDSKIIDLIDGFKDRGLWG